LALRTTTALSRPTRVDHKRPGVVQDSSRVHQKPIDQLGIQLYPGSLATSTPQAFLVASPPARQAGYGVVLRQEASKATHCIPTHIRQVRVGATLTELQTLVSLVYRLILASRTRTVWQCQPVPALSAPLATFTGVSRIQLRPAPTQPLRRPGEKVLHLLRFPAPHGAQALRGAGSFPSPVTALVGGDGPWAFP
jgi:hypothetical protein